MSKIKLFAAATLAISMAACASTSSTEGSTASKSSASESSESAGTKNTKGETQTHAAALADTHAAAEAALKLHGFDITESTDTVIKGQRPRKVGLVVGSGGEKITVSLAATGDASTEVNVETRKTFVGIAGQKNWDGPVQAAIKEKLGE